ncbi:hypothetical protein JTB14_032590 [Gonioctena quinquepunctata]|nr:hypothetical protein JTB14_032590 [Gonioctena quinquepunctata]
MSFLADVLSSAEEVEMEEINKKVPELKFTVENLKVEIVQYIESVYVKYSFRPTQNKELLQKAYAIEEEIKTLKKNADIARKKDLAKSSKELEEHIDNLQTLNFTIHILSRQCEINVYLSDFESFFQAREYLKCATSLSKLEKTMDDIPYDEKIDIPNITTKKNMLITELENVFSKNINIKNDHKTVTLEVRKDIGNLEEALLALFHITAVASPIHKFAKSLWNMFLVPTVNNKVNIVAGHSDTFHFIQITVKDTTKKSDYLQVFSNLRTVLDFLEKYFNFKLNDELTALEYIGIDIRDNLSELLIKNCLQDTIPSTLEGLQKYKDVIEDTKKLDEVLRNCKMFAEDTTSIVDYTNNIDVLFINKMCQDHLITAREIMKKDMHDLVEVGVPYNPLFCSSKEFLQCSVSKSVIELMNFAKEILEQAIIASDVCAGRLFCTLRKIFQMYGEFVPEFHKKLLQTIPQQVALLHNNCLYISFNLTEWNKTYCLKQPSTLIVSNIRFTEEAHQLQLIASETFTSYVKGQIKQINDIMKESGLDGGTLKEIQPVTEKSVRQCLNQQELLKTVWQKVLSYPIYNQTLGEILNSLCVCIITSVVRYEDISLSSPSTC